MAPPRPPARPGKLTLPQARRIDAKVDARLGEKDDPGSAVAALQRVGPPKMKARSGKR